MKNWLIVLSSLMLAACATKPARAPEPIVRTVEVKVPVPVVCKAQVDVTPYAFDDVPIGLELDDHVRALLVDRLQRQQTEKLLRAALKACTVD